MRLACPLTNPVCKGDRKVHHLLWTQNSQKKIEVHNGRLPNYGGIFGVMITLSTLNTQDYFPLPIILIPGWQTCGWIIDGLRNSSALWFKGRPTNGKAETRLTRYSPLQWSGQFLMDTGTIRDFFSMRSLYKEIFRETPPCEIMGLWKASILAKIKKKIIWQVAKIVPRAVTK